MPSKAPYIASAIPLGVATLVYLNTRESDFQKRVEACGNDPYAKGNDDYYQTTKTVDTFMCIITPFFKGASSMIGGEFVLYALTTLFFSVLVLGSIEATRSGNTVARILFPVIMFLSQLAGISVIVPAVFLPVYWYTSVGAGDKGLDPAAVWGIAGSALFIMIPTTVGFVVPANLENLQVFAFQFSPIVAALAVSLPLVPSLLGAPFANAAGTKSASAAVREVCIFFAGICSLLWVITAVKIGSWYLSSSNPTFDEFTRGVWGFKTEAEFAVHFLVVDVLVLFAAMLMNVHYESGSGEAVHVIIQSLFMSPGAALCLWRARTFGSASGDSRDKTE